jgi:hypothetical protein
MVDMYIGLYFNSFLKAYQQQQPKNKLKVSFYIHLFRDRQLGR